MQFTKPIVGSALLMAAVFHAQVSSSRQEVTLDRPQPQQPTEITIDCPKQVGYLGCGGGAIFGGIGLGAGNGTSGSFAGQIFVTHGIYGFPSGGLMWEAGANRMSTDPDFHAFGSINGITAWPINHRGPEAVFGTFGGTLGGGTGFGPMNFGIGLDGQAKGGVGWRIEARDYSDFSHHNLSFRVVLLGRYVERSVTAR